MRRQKEKHNLCVRLCFFDVMVEGKWDDIHTRIAGLARSSSCLRSYWQPTPTRELRVQRVRIVKSTVHWQSTPTRELREDIAAVADSPYRLAIHTHARIAGAIRMQL